MDLTKLLSIISTIVIGIMTIFDVRRQNTIITPFSLSAWPLVFIIITVNFLLIYIGFDTVTPRVIVFLFINLLLIWIIGTIFSKIYINKNNFSFIEIFAPYVKFELILILISWIVNFAVFYKVRNLMASYGGLSVLGNPKFEEMMISGPVAHLAQYGKVTFILLSFMYPLLKHKFITLFTLFGLVITFFALQVKYNLIGVLLMVFFYYNYVKTPQKQISNIFRFSLATVLLMALFLVILTVFWGTFAVSKKSVWLFLSKNLLSYFFSSPIVLDKWLDHAFVQPDWTLLLVFKNVINRICGNPFVYNALNYVDLNFSEVAPDIYSNVATSYGTYYIIGGWTFCLFMTALISVINYIIFTETNKRPTPIKIFLNMTLLNIAFMSFFGQYFTYLSYYEMIIFFVITIKIMDCYNAFVYRQPNEININKSLLIND